MNRIVDLMTAVAFALTLAGCESTPPVNPNSGIEDNSKWNLTSNTDSPQSHASSEMGGQTGSSSVRRSP